MDKIKLHMDFYFNGISCILYGSGNLLNGPQKHL